MMGKLDPQKTAAVRKVSSNINATISINYKENSYTLQLKGTTPESVKFVKEFVPNFAQMVAEQLGMFFGIKGEMIDVNKE